MKTSQMAAMALIVFVAEMPIWANDADREHYLEGFRRAGLR